MDIVKEIAEICRELEEEFKSLFSLVFEALDLLEQLDITHEECDEVRLYLNGFLGNLVHAELLLIEDGKIIRQKTKEVQLKEINDLLAKMAFICSDAHFALDDEEEDEIYQASFQLLQKIQQKQLLLTTLPIIEKMNTEVSQIYYPAKEALEPFIHKRMLALIRNQSMEINETELKTLLEPLFISIEKINKIRENAKTYETIHEEKIYFYLDQMERRWQDLCSRALPLLYELSQYWLSQATVSREILEKNIKFLQTNTKHFESDKLDRIQENIRQLKEKKNKIKEEKVAPTSYLDYLYFPSFIKIPWLSTDPAILENPSMTIHKVRL